MASGPKLRHGDRMPEFELEGQDGKVVRSTDLLGKGPLVIYFYPHDGTPGCTAEACAFRDTYEDFQDAGARVVGICSESVGSHRRFAEGHHLPFTLLSDPNGRVKADFGIRSKLKIIPKRITFVIDSNGRIEFVFESLMRPEEHATKALETVRKMVIEAAR